MKIKTVPSPVAAGRPTVCVIGAATGILRLRPMDSGILVGARNWKRRRSARRLHQASSALRRPSGHALFHPFLRALTDIIANSQACLKQNSYLFSRITCDLEAVKIR
jgi:hypothetical protein